MVSWRPAPAIEQWRSEVNEKYPNRSKRTDGIIGNAEHSSRASDHNPNSRGYVCAMDTTLLGVSMPHLIQCAITDGRTNYFIFNRVIWSRSRGFVPRAYFGASAHTGHGHLSVLQSPQAYMSRASWGIASSGSASAGAGTTSPGLPSTGADPTPTQPEEDTLSAADVAELKAFIKTTIQTQHNASNELIGGRPALNRIGQTAADYVSKTGFSRSIIELHAEAAGRHAANAIRAQITELKGVLAQIQKTGSLTDAQVKDLEEKTHTAALLGSEQGAKQGITEGLTEVTETWNAALREVLTEVLFDLGKDSSEEIIELAMQEIANRVAPEGATA